MRSGWLYQFQKSLRGKTARFKQRSFPRVHVLHRYRRRLHQSIFSENGISVTLIASMAQAPAEGQPTWPNHDQSQGPKNGLAGQGVFYMEL